MIGDVPGEIDLHGFFGVEFLYDLPVPFSEKRRLIVFGHHISCNVLDDGTLGSFNAGRFNVEQPVDKIKKITNEAVDIINFSALRPFTTNIMMGLKEVIPGIRFFNNFIDPFSHSTA